MAYQIPRLFTVAVETDENLILVSSKCPQAPQAWGHLEEVHQKTPKGVGDLCISSPRLEELDRRGARDASTVSDVYRSSRLSVRMGSEWGAYLRRVLHYKEKFQLPISYPASSVRPGNE